METTNYGMMLAIAVVLMIFGGWHATSIKRTTTKDEGHLKFGLLDFKYKSFGSLAFVLGFVLVVLLQFPSLITPVFQRERVEGPVNVNISGDGSIGIGKIENSSTPIQQNYGRPQK